MSTTETFSARARRVIGFFDYPDVFEDFYPHYGVTQRAFAKTWAATGNHGFVRQLQRLVGDVVWYEFSLDPETEELQHHEEVGCGIRFLQSSFLHRLLWRLFYLPKSSWKWRRFYRPYAVVASYLAPLSWSLLRALRRDQPDLLFLQDYASGRFDVLLLLSRMLRIPLAAYHSGSRPDGYLGRPVRGFSLRRADLLIASSRSERSMLIDHFGVDPDRAVVILTPIDTETYRPMDREAACRRLGLDPGKPYFLFVGRLVDDVKRISSIIRALSRVASRECMLIVAGDGPDRSQLESLAREIAPGRVLFLGWIGDPSEKAQLYNTAEALVLASKREGFPTVVGESMACGIPVLSSDVGAVSELVVDGATGWLFPASDESTLQEKMQWVIDHPRETASMRASVRKKALKRVSPEVVDGETRQALTQVLARP